VVVSRVPRPQDPRADIRNPSADFYDRFERRAAAAALVEQMNELIGSTFLALDGAIRIPPRGALSGDAPRRGRR